MQATTETRQTLPQPNDPVIEPITYSPFGALQWRLQLETSTKAYAPALPGRRDSQNIPPVAGSRKLRADTHSSIDPLNRTPTKQGKSKLKG